jgi:capsular polysaccharide export protein
MADPARPRVLCILQGPSGDFLRRLAGLLAARGIRTLRVNLCAGDWLDWRGGGTRFTGRPAAWPGFIAEFLRAHGVTDLLLLAEKRPLHRAAIAEAQRLGIAVHALELGYLRPHWLTLVELDQAGEPAVPRDPRAILAAAADLPAPSPDPAWPGSLPEEAFFDLRFHLANLLGRPFFPHYRSHLLAAPLLTDLGIGLHLLLARLGRHRTARRAARIQAAPEPYFLLPLQIANDLQIRAYSDFAGIGAVLDHVLASFARAAPPACRLVVKEHPREVLWLRWRRRIAERAARLGLAGRVVTIDGGAIGTLIDGARGVVTVNSTTGLAALRQHRPVKVLGRAIFDLPGLTHQGDLDGFWTAPAAPDPILVDAHIRLLAATLQIRGGFYGRTAKAQALAALADRFAARVRTRDAVSAPPARGQRTDPG